MKRRLQTANILSVIFIIGANTLIATGTIGGSITQMSDRLSTLLTPARYAFSIWSVIFVLVTVLAMYQARDIFNPQEANRLPHKMSGFFIAANCLSGIWTYVFTNGYILSSVFVMLGLIFALCGLLSRLRVALDDPPWQEITCVWWPLQMYTGWVAVACVVNIASWLASVGVTLSSFGAVVVLVSFAAALSYLLWSRNTRLLVLASTWGIVAIAYGQLSVVPLVGTAAGIIAGILILETAVHAYFNYSTHPFFRLLN